MSKVVQLPRCGGTTNNPQIPAWSRALAGQQQDTETLSLLRHIERLATAGKVRDVHVTMMLDGEELQVGTGRYADEREMLTIIAGWLADSLNRVTDSEIAQGIPPTPIRSR